MFKPNIEKMKIKKNIKGIIKTLNHSNSKFRMEAAVVLGNLKEKEAMEPLIQALDDEDINVIKAAIELVHYTVINDFYGNKKEKEIYDLEREKRECILAEQVKDLDYLTNNVVTTKTKPLNFIE